MGGWASVASAATPFEDIGLASGPLTKISIGNDLSCQAAHSADSVFEFFPSSATPGDCGTFVYVDGTLFTPDFANHTSTATTNLGTRTVFTPVSQTAPTGTGTEEDPRQVTTTVTLGGTGIQIDQTDSYVAGQESYSTQITFTNTGGNPKDVLLYRAGDCYLQGSDKGYGFSTANNAVGCSATANNSPAGRVLVWTPQSPGASFTENTYSVVWSQIAQHAPFPNDCGQCTNLVDNGAGLSWSLTVPPGTATAVRSSAAGFSPTGELPPGSEPPSGGGPPGPAPPGGGGNSDPACQDPTVILVRCVNTTGAFTIPGVCGPSFGTILPACNIPTYPPTVCGPSFGTILTACQLPKPKIIACGGFGTILPQCNHPPPSVPQVCGGTGTLLPPCTGGNQLALACGPSTGTALPPCNFPTKINATVLEPNKTATVTVDLGCPAPGARATAAGGGARAAKNDPDTCDMTLVLKGMRVTLWETLAAHAADVAQNFVRLAGLKNEFVDLQPRLTPDEKTLQKQANLREGEADRKAFGARVGQLLSLYLGPSNRPKDVLSRDQIYELLTKRAGNPPYLNPEGGVAIGEPIDTWALNFENAVRRYRQLEDLAAGKKLATLEPAALVRAAQIARPKGGRVLSKRYRVRTGRKRGSKRRGKTQKIRIRLSKRTVNGLIGEARRSKGSKRVIPLRLLISYSGKLQGRSITVGRLIDVQLRVKPRAKPKRKKHR